jgi:hypothetical protein
MALAMAEDFEEADAEESLRLSKVTACLST